MDSRLPKLIFVLLALYAAFHFASVYPQLPDVVASHFNGRGAANGWQTKQAFFRVIVLVCVLVTVIGFAIPKMIAIFPKQMINLPNKNYWLAPERAAETMAYFETTFAWFGCATFLFNILVFDYALQINLHPQDPPSPERFWYILIGFLAFTLAWTIRILTRFLRPPESNSGS